MICPDEINARWAEYLVLGLVVKDRDTVLFSQLDRSIFTVKECVELYEFMHTYGVSSAQKLKQNLKDKKKSELQDAVDLCQNFTTYSGEIQDALQILNEKAVQRKLARLSLDVNLKLEVGDDPYDIIHSIDRTLGEMFISRKGIVQYNSSLKALEVLSRTQIIGIQTGMPKFDDATGGLMRGGILSVAGVSANLKSTSVLALTRSILKTNENMKACFFQVEMNASDMVYMILGQLGVDRTKFIKGGYTKEEIEEILENDPLRERFNFYTAEGDNVKCYDDIQKIVLREKPDVWVIDYMGQLVMTESLMKKRDSGRHNIYFAETMTLLKILAQRTNSICILLHQADAKVNKTRSDYRPRLEDIEYSQDIFRLSSYIYMAYYPYKYYSFTSPEAVRLFIQIWRKIRYANSTYAILEVDPTTGIFSTPSPRIDQLGEAHWYKLDGGKDRVFMQESTL